MNFAINKLFQAIARLSSRNNFEPRICFVFLLLHRCLHIVYGNEPNPVNSYFLRANRLVEKQDKKIVGFETSRHTHQSHQFALEGFGGRFRREGAPQFVGPDHKIQFSGTGLDGLGYSLSAASAVDGFEDVRSTIALGWKSGGLMSLNGDMGASFFSPDKIGRPQESVALISQTGDDAPEPAGIVIVASSPHSSCFAFKNRAFEPVVHCYISAGLAWTSILELRPPFNISGCPSTAGASNYTCFGLALATWASAVAVTGVTGKGRRFVSTHCLGFRAMETATADFGIGLGCSEAEASESSSWETLISHEQTFGDALAMGPAGRLAIGIPGMDSGRGVVAVYRAGTVAAGLEGNIRANTTRQWRLSQELKGSSLETGGFFGAALSDGPEYLVVGAPSSAKERWPTVHVYAVSMPQSLEMVCSIPCPERKVNGFGSSVAQRAGEDWTIIAVGSPEEGRVYILWVGRFATETSPRTCFIRNIFIGEGVEGRFGAAVALTAGFLFIGAPNATAGRGGLYSAAYCDASLTITSSLTDQSWTCKPCADQNSNLSDSNLSLHEAGGAKNVFPDGGGRDPCLCLGPASMVVCSWICNQGLVYSQISRRCLRCEAYLAELGISFCQTCTASEAGKGSGQYCCDGREPVDASSTRAFRCEAAVSGAIVLKGMRTEALPSSSRTVLQETLSRCGSIPITSVLLFYVLRSGSGVATAIFRMILQDASEAVIVMECILKNVSSAVTAALDSKGQSIGMSYITSAAKSFRTQPVEVTVTNVTIGPAPTSFSCSAGLFLNWETATCCPTPFTYPPAYNGSGASEITYSWEPQGCSWKCSPGRSGPSCLNCSEQRAADGRQADPEFGVWDDSDPSKCSTVRCNPGHALAAGGSKCLSVVQMMAGCSLYKDCSRCVSNNQCVWCSGHCLAGVTNTQDGSGCPYDANGTATGSSSSSGCECSARGCKSRCSTLSCGDCLAETSCGWCSATSRCMVKLQGLCSSEASSQACSSESSLPSGLWIFLLSCIGAAISLLLVASWVCALRFRADFSTSTVSHVQGRKGIPQLVLDTYPCFKYSLPGSRSPQYSYATENMLNSPAVLLAERQFQDPLRAPISVEEHEAEVKCNEAACAGCSCTVCSAVYQEGQELRMLPCLHVFHRSCVDALLQETSECPFCKMSLVGTTAQSPNTVRGSAFNGAQELHFSVRSSTPARPIVTVSTPARPIVNVKAFSPISQLSAQLHRRLLDSSQGSFTSNILALSLDSHFQLFGFEREQDSSTFIADAPASHCSTDSVASQSPFHLSSAAEYAELELESLEGTDSTESSLIASVPCMESLSPPIAFASEHQTEDLAAADECCEDCDHINSADIAPEMAATVVPRAVEPVPSLQTAFSTRHSARLGTSDPVLVIPEMGWESTESESCEMYHVIFQEFGVS